MKEDHGSLLICDLQSALDRSHFRRLDGQAGGLLSLEQGSLDAVDG